MSTARKILLFAVGLILVVGFIAIGLTIFNKAKSGVQNAVGQYDKVVSQFDDIDYALYDNGQASGNEVLGVIRALKVNNDGVTVVVKTNQGKAAAGAGAYAGVSFKYGNAAYTTNIDNAVDKTNDEYINPRGQFSSTIDRDSNSNVVTKITFIQK